MAKKAIHLSPRQQEIMDLLKGTPSITVAELAEVLDTTEGAIHQQMTRMRASGALPKVKPRGQVVKVTGVAGDPEPEAPARNGSAHGDFTLTLEEHLDGELTSVVARIEEIMAMKTALETEEQDLAVRRSRLSEAQKALQPA